MPSLRAAAAPSRPASCVQPAIAGRARAAQQDWRRLPHPRHGVETVGQRPWPLRGLKRRVARWSSGHHATTARRALRRLIGWYIAEACGSLRKSRYLLRAFFAGFLAGGAAGRAKHKEWFPPAAFGREDEAPEEIVAEEKPAVLTDQICLIPGDAPVVRVEDAPGNARRIFTGVDIRASVDDVWSVMTDYEQLEEVVPNLVHNQVIEKTDDGGARLWQIGRASWQILGRSFYFQAGTTLDVRLFPEGLPEEHIAGAQIDASSQSSSEARAMGKRLSLVRDIFPRPFSLSASGVPVHDITMQNVKGERGDFVHYQGVWRLQPLHGCAPPEQDMMRLTFAVECEPHWFLPVAPVEGRIAHALVENMEAIRNHVEAKRLDSASLPTAEEPQAGFFEQGGSSGSSSRSSSNSTKSLTSSLASSAASDWMRPFSPAYAATTALNSPVLSPLGALFQLQGGAEPTGETLLAEFTAGLVEAAEKASSTFSDKVEAAFGFLGEAAGSQEPSISRGEGGKTAGGLRALKPQVPAGPFLQRSPFGPGPGRLASGLGQLSRRSSRTARRVAATSTSEIEELVEAMTRTLERAQAVEAGAAAESASVGVGTAVETSSTAVLGGLTELAMGLEAETLLAASVAAGLAASATILLPEARDRELALKATSEEADSTLSKVWLAVCKQHPRAVREGHFLGMSFARKDVEARWPRLVQTLGISEEQALEIVETDATPLLVEPSDVSEVLSRLAAISSREKALELVHWNPALLVGGAPWLKEEKDPGMSILVDVLYAGRLYKVLEEVGRDAAEKLKEIEWYTYAVTGIKPILDVFQKGALTATTSRLCRRPIEIAAQVVPNSAVRVFLSRLAAVPDPWGFMVDQAKAGMLMTSSLLSRPSLTASIIPYSPSILPHLPSIYTRLSILRPHVPGIARILDPYFSVVEPHLDRIMERMDEIEPHLPYILIHLDVLAKHCGPLLDHFDELIKYASSKAEIGSDYDSWKVCYEEPAGERLSADSIAACVIENWDEFAHDEIERAKEEESYLPRLLPYVDFLVPKLDILAPHLPLVHPHLPHILPYIDKLMPYIPLFAAHPKASKNADVLVGYLGWTLRIPLLPRVLYVPMVPRLVAGLSTVLPRRLIRPVLERRRRRREEAEQRAERVSAPVGQALNMRT